MNNNLKWKKSLFSNTCNIYSNGQLVGNLKDKSFSKSADGELNGAKYRFKTQGLFNLIDNRYSYGIDGTMPRTEIKSISIKWNEINLTIPDSAFTNLYEPHLCLDYLPVEAYIFKNQYLYIYINGSDAACSFSVKFVFDKRKYLTRIVGTNEMTNGFDFLDGTAKYDNTTR